LCFHGDALCCFLFFLRQDNRPLDAGSVEARRGAAEDEPSHGGEHWSLSAAAPGQSGTGTLPDVSYIDSSWPRTAVSSKTRSVHSLSARRRRQKPSLVL